jgi:hypothetical protein
MTLSTNPMMGVQGLPRGAGSSASQWKRGGDPGDVIPRNQRVTKLGNFSPEQQQQFSSLFEQVGPQSYLAKLAGGDQSAFEEMEAPAHRQFQDILGGIANRFSNAGSGGRRSGAFQRATSSAASNFAEDLQARRQEIRRNALRDLMGFSDALLTQRPFTKGLVGKGPSDAQSLLLAGIGAGGNALGGYLQGRGNADEKSDSGSGGSSWLSSLLGAGGATLGGIFGGPVGAAAGGLAGKSFGGYLSDGGK